MPYPSYRSNYRPGDLSTQDLAGRPVRGSLGNSKEMARNEKGRQLAYGIWALIIALVWGGLYLLSGGAVVPVIAVALAIIAVVVIICWPQAMMWFAFTSACLVELEYFKNFQLGITDRIPIFWDVNTIFQWYLRMPNFHFVPFSLLEFLFIFAFLSWLVRGVVDKSLKIRTGSLIVPVCVYFGFVVYGVFNGIFNSAHLNDELFEVRAQFYFMFGYIMAMNSTTEPRKQVSIMSWTLAACVAYKACFAAFRYIVEQHGHTYPEVGIGAHEESFFFDAYFVQLLILFLGRLQPKLQIFMLVFLPVVMWMELVNMRRAAIAALAIGVPIVLMLCAVGFPQRRKFIVGLATVLVVLGVVYLGAFWNSNSTLAEPARAIKSQFSPDPRDAMSNIYRQQEDANLYYTMQQEPLLGYGYGRPFIEHIPMVDLTVYDSLVHFIPHDQILWVWMRLGTLGFFAFWIMFAMIIICCVQISRDTRYYPDIRYAGAFTAVMTIMLLIFGLLDMQISNCRDMLFVSIWVGTVAYLRSHYMPTFASDEPGMLIAPPGTHFERAKTARVLSQEPAK